MVRPFVPIAVAGPDEHALRADGGPGRDVVRAVADDKRSTEVELMIGCRPPEQARLRLPAVAGLSIGLDARVGMMRTEIESVDARAARCECSRTDRCVASTNARRTCLERCPPGSSPRSRDEVSAVEQPDRVDAVRKEADAVEPIEIAHFLDQRAVAIQEHATFHVPPPLRSVPKPARAAASPRDHAMSTVITLHAPVIDRAVAHHARPAEHGMGQDVGRHGWPDLSGPPRGDVTRSSVGPKIATTGTRARLPGAWPRSRSTRTPSTWS